MLTATGSREHRGSSHRERVVEGAVEETAIVAAEGPAYDTTLVRGTSDLGLGLMPCPVLAAVQRLGVPVDWVHVLGGRSHRF